MSLGTGSSSASETRKKSYKSGIDAEEGRRRRQEGLVTIRKNKRQDTLIKKRTQTHITHSRDMLLEAIPAMVQRLCSMFSAAQLETATHLLTLADHCPPIDELVKEGVVPLFVELLSRDDAPQLQLRALLVLTNISSGTSQHTRVIVELGVVPSLVNLLSSSSIDDIKEEIVCTLGNIAGDSPSYRDLVLNHGALLPLLSQLNSLPRLSMLRVTTWTLSNLVHGKPPVNFEQVKPALPVLQQLIHETDEEVVTDACRALSYLSDGPVDKIQAIIELGVCPKLVELLQHPSDTVILPALRTLGNIVTADHVHTQLVIDNQLLPRLHQILMHEYKKDIFIEACWTISNITSGNRAQIQAVIDANIIPLLVQVLHHAEFDIKKEAAWAIFNVTAGGSYDHIQFLVAEGCIMPLCELLTCPDPKVVSICLKGLENILRVGEAAMEMGLHGRDNIFAQRVDECDGFDKIEKLLTHDNVDIFKKALRILKRFWPQKDLGDIMDLQNARDGSQQDFSFEINQQDLPPRGFNFGS